jgi:signal transduction histidine kinase
MDMVKEDIKRKILVIEDAQSLRRDIIEMLSFEGFMVEGAENGVVGIARAREYLPDLIICDIMMPAMDGYTVLEKLRQDKLTATIPFIFLTARTDRVDMRQGMELGADDYLTKPFTAVELLATVRTRLKKIEDYTEDSKRRMDDLRQNITIALPHELRTPLNVILGFSELLMIDYAEMEPARMGDMAGHINGAAIRLFRLIENFLLYANIELIASSDEQREAILRNVTPNPKFMIQFVATQKAQHAERAQDMTLKLADVAALAIMEDFLKKIIDELVDNAIKFSEPGTPIVIEAMQEGDTYVITIQDAGRGMTPDQIRSVGAYNQFERSFYEHQGAGLGLIIAQRLAELHNGQLFIDSVYHQQTSITVKLPIAQVE